MSELERMVGRDERIFWRGKPDKKCFILESIFNPLLPFAVIWLLFDSFFIRQSMAVGGQQMTFVFVFMLFHLMPVWIYMGGILLSARRHRHTQYIVTDKGIYVSGGVFSFTSRMKPFTELSNIEIHRGIIDQRLGLGDVVVSSSASFSSQSYSNRNDTNLALKDLEDYQRVYDLIKRLQADIYSDTLYPNDLRPDSNHGYNTKYHYDDDYRR